MHFCFNQNVPVSTRQQDISMITTDGHQLEVSSPSSIAPYTIPLAIHRTEVASLSSTIHTDFLKAVNVANDPTLQAKWAGKEIFLSMSTWLYYLAKFPISNSVTSKHAANARKMCPGPDPNGVTTMWT